MENEETVKKYMMEEAVARIDLLTGGVCEATLAEDTCVFFDDFGPASGDYPIPEEYLKWASEVVKEALNHWDVGSKLVSKIVAAAKATVEERENVVATIMDWKLFGARGHEVIASVAVEVTTDEGNKTFEVWVVANLGTEEVYCL